MWLNTLLMRKKTDVDSGMEKCLNSTSLGKQFLAIEDSITTLI